MRPERPIRPLDSRRADAVIVRRSRDPKLLLTYQARRSVPPRLLTTYGTEFLDDLAVIDPGAKVVLDRFGVAGKAVRREVKPARRRARQLAHEGIRVFRGAPSKVPGENKFRRAVKADEAIRVPGVRGHDLLPLDRGGLGRNVGPQLDRLYVARLYAGHQAVEQPLATGANEREESENRALLGAGDSLNRPDARAFAEQGKNQERPLAGNPNLDRGPVLGLGEDAAAGPAPELLAPVAGLPEPVELPS